MLPDQRLAEGRRSRANPCQVLDKRRGTGVAYVYPGGGHSVTLLGGLGTRERHQGWNLGCQTGEGAGGKDCYLLLTQAPLPPQVCNGTPTSAAWSRPPGKKISQSRSRD